MEEWKAMKFVWQGVANEPYNSKEEVLRMNEKRIAERNEKARQWWKGFEKLVFSESREQFLKDMKKWNSSGDEKVSGKEK